MREPDQSESRAADLRPRRVRPAAAIVALGVALVLGGGAALARWADTAAISDAELDSGRVELAANGSASATLTAITITPTFGSATADQRAVTIANAGNVPLRYRLDDLTASPGSTADLVNGGLALRVATVADPAACTSATAGTEIPLVGGSTLLGAAFIDRRELAVAAGETLCVALTIADPAEQVIPAGTATLTLHFHGETLP